MKRGPKPKSEEDKKKSKVIRISDSNYSAIKRLLKGRTFDVFFQWALPILNKEVSFLVGSRLFKDVKQARGESVLQMRKTGELIKPKIVLLIGEDNGI